ncbi:MAG: hypothetical protein KDA41_00870, partial [Planctomycetales bacterium]|nr:hypothetical protein [Planctomycetales bacterium]
TWTMALRAETSLADERADDAYCIAVRVVQRQVDGGEQVLSAPKLVTLAGRPAWLTVGEQHRVPVAAKQQEVVEVGLSMRCTLHVDVEGRAKDTVKLDVDFDLTELQNDEPGKFAVRKTGLRTILTATLKQKLTLPLVESDGVPTKWLEMTVSHAPPPSEPSTEMP